MKLLSTLTKKKLLSTIFIEITTSQQVKIQRKKQFKQDDTYRLHHWKCKGTIAKFRVDGD